MAKHLTAQDHSGDCRSSQARFQRPSVLVVSRADQDHVLLGELFRASEWRVLDAAGLGEVRHLLTWDRVSLIICDSKLADGSWKDILSLIAPLPEPPRLVVASDRFGPESWSEALHLGAFDMLRKPFEKEQVARVANSVAIH